MRALLSSENPKGAKFSEHMKHFYFILFVFVVLFFNHNITLQIITYNFTFFSNLK